MDSERDPFDARWVYYSVNLYVSAALNRAFGAFFDPARIKPRRFTCGPQSVSVMPEPAASSRALNTLTLLGGQILRAKSAMAHR